MARTSGFERILAVLVPLGWFSLAFTTGDVIAAALDERSSAVAWVGGIGAWAWWGAGLVVLLVPRTTSLTAARILIPAAAPVTAVAIYAADEVSALGVIGLTTSGALAVLVLSAPFGFRFVNGSSYGDEQRFLLRPPIAALAGPAEVLWVLMVASAIAAPLLLAARSWVAGAAVALVGGLVWWVGVRSMHNLSRRWIVLVPAGLVIHDPLALLDTLLVQKGELVRVGPAAADTTATDLTMGAAGLALQVDLSAPVELLALTARGFGAQSESTQPGLAEGTERVMLQHVLVAPTRPGALMAALAARRLPTT